MAGFLLCIDNQPAMETIRPLLHFIRIMWRDSPPRQQTIEEAGLFPGDGMAGDAVVVDPTGRLLVACSRK
jgi:hypothetical protein